MNGDDLLEEFRRRIMKARGTKSVTDSVLAKWIGVTQPQLVNYRRALTPKKIVNLVEKYARANQRQLVEATVVPIVEYLHIDPVESKQGKNWTIFLAKDGCHPYLVGLRKQLERARGIYVFHDSRGRAIYAGKAHRRSLWPEMNNAFNRDRGEVQSIKRVTHPRNRVSFDTSVLRQIQRRSVPLHELASYCSAYEVPDEMIGKFEALIVRAFANDLLNVRMENF